METPKRAYALTITIGGDTWDDVMDDLQRIPHHVKEHGPSCDSTMGGPSSGHTIKVEHDPEMTHERYFELVDLWLAQQRSLNEGLAKP